MTDLDSNHQMPKVTVVLAVRNEEKNIKATLDSIAHQDYESDKMEIIIADGVSTDRTREIAQAFKGPLPNLNVIINKKKMTVAGLNCAIQNATGKIIVRVDGHTRLEKDYVRQCVQELIRTKADNVGGRMQPQGSHFVGQAVAFATSTPFGIGDAHFHYIRGEKWVDTVYMGAWWRSLFDRMGYFDEQFACNEDDEFNYRLRKAGGKIFLSPKIRSVYQPRESISRLAMQYFKYGFWKVRVLRKHPLQMRPRQFIPGLFVGTLIMGPILGLLKLGWIVWLFSGGYIILNCLYSIKIALEQGMRYLFIMPGVFATLHLSYGAGFLSGLCALFIPFRSGKK